jgi:D-alanyl-D-alanine carboxypeptidase
MLFLSFMAFIRSLYRLSGYTVGMLRKKRRLILVAGLVLVFSGTAWAYVATRTDKPSETPQQTTQQTPSTDQPVAEKPKDVANPKTEPKPAEAAAFDKSQYSTSEPGSIWWAVNKTRPLPAGYAPEDLITPNVALSGSYTRYRKIAQTNLEAMFAAATKADAPLTFGSGFRSESVQRQLYNGYVAADGQAAADRYSARPGTSEHQTGLSFDAGSPSGSCYLEVCYGKTAQGLWLATHAHKYGFIVRYPNGKEAVTGYQYEPWHMRYVGVELATEMRRTGIATLEEFFGLLAAPSYKP